MHPKYKTTYRVGNWAEYDRALVRRGDVTLWLTPDAIATWAAAGVGRRSGQLQYSDLAIETALTLSLIFHLPLRQTEGFLTSIFGMLGVDLTAPDHTTLSRRGQHLALALRRARPGTSLHLIVDSTGLSIVGEGEWAAAKHGGRGRRGWRKLHLGVDGSRVIVACALTEPTADDAITGIRLVDERGSTNATATRKPTRSALPAQPSSYPVKAERSDRLGGDIQEQEAIQNSELAAVHDRPEPPRRVLEEIGKGHLPTGDKSDVRDEQAERDQGSAKEFDHAGSTAERQQLRTVSIEHTE